MYDTCIMKEQIKKKSVEGRKGLWTIAVEVRSKTKAISVMMDSCTHSVFPLMPEDSIFCGFVFHCAIMIEIARTTVLVVRFCFAVLYCLLKNDSKEALNMMKNMVLATNFGKANE